MQLGQPLPQWLEDKRPYATAEQYRPTWNVPLVSQNEWHHVQFVSYIWRCANYNGSWLDYSLEVLLRVVKRKSRKEYEIRWPTEAETRTSASLLESNSI
eukprot:IDg21665t1